MTNLFILYHILDHDSAVFILRNEMLGISITIEEWVVYNPHLNIIRPIAFVYRNLMEGKNLKRFDAINISSENRI